MVDVGTTLYMAPEMMGPQEDGSQRRKKAESKKHKPKVSSAKADMYSLGVSLEHLNDRDEVCSCSVGRSCSLR